MLTATRALADYFEDVVQAGAPAKPAANWIPTELLRRLNDSGREIDASPVSPAALADLLRRVEAGSITGASGKKVFAAMFETRQIGRGDHRRRRTLADPGHRRDRAAVPRSDREESRQRGQVSREATRAYSSFSWAR